MNKVIKNIKTHKAILLEILLLFGFFFYQTYKRNYPLYAILSIILFFVGAIILFKKPKEKTRRNNKVYIIETVLSIFFIVVYFAIALFVKTKVSNELFEKESESTEYASEFVIENGGAILLDNHYFTYIGKVKRATVIVYSYNILTTLEDFADKVKNDEIKTEEDLQYYKNLYSSVENFTIDEIDISLNALALLYNISVITLSLAVAFNPFSILNIKFTKQ